jgi:hypothetical protein
MNGTDSRATRYQQYNHTGIDRDSDIFGASISEVVKPTLTAVGRQNTQKYTSIERVHYRASAHDGIREGSEKAARSVKRATLKEIFKALFTNADFSEKAIKENDEAGERFAGVLKQITEDLGKKESPAHARNNRD